MIEKKVVHTADEVLKAIQEAKRGDLIVWEDSAGIMHEYQKKKDAYIANLKIFLTQNKTKEK